MNISLSAEARRAVDIVMDGRITQTQSWGNHMSTESSDPMFQKRVQRLGKILEVLSTLPAAEPPRDLLSRTMARIDQVRSIRPQGEPGAAFTMRPADH